MSRCQLIFVFVLHSRFIVINILFNVISRVCFGLNVHQIVKRIVDRFTIAKDGVLRTNKVDIEYVPYHMYFVICSIYYLY